MITVQLHQIILPENCADNPGRWLLQERRRGTQLGFDPADLNAGQRARWRRAFTYCAEVNITGDLNDIKGEAYYILNRDDRVENQNIAMYADHYSASIGDVLVTDINGKREAHIISCMGFKQLTGDLADNFTGTQLDAVEEQAGRVVEQMGNLEFALSLELTDLGCRTTDAQKDTAIYKKLVDINRLLKKRADELERLIV